MLIKKDLLAAADEQYKPMLKEVSIPDFTKCIAQFSGLHISKVSDEAIKTYLLTWAKNKYRFYQLLGNKLKVDNKIQYKDENKDVETEMRALEKDYPAYALWLEGFKYVESNKINVRDVEWTIRNTVDNIFPGCRLDSCSVTHFFKSYLNAPDELVTKIGRIWENEMVEGIYTISIDPVDMMLASENPYNWNSCYRLELGNSDSHADGCLAAVIDDSSLISYVWNNEGKFKLYDNYELKSIRYKKMRMWFSLSEHMTTVHFNTIYPGKSSYSKGFVQKVRYIIEEYLSKQLKVNNMWKHGERVIERYFDTYGYDEFDEDYLFYQADSEEEKIWPYNQQIICPCGCGNIVCGSQASDDMCYNGEGFLAENFAEEIYCDEMEEYTDCNGECHECSIWRQNHPVCELDENESCERDTYEAENEGDFNADRSNIMHCNPEHCSGCPLYKYHHQEEDPDAADNAHEQLKISADER